MSIRELPSITRGNWGLLSAGARRPDQDEHKASTSSGHKLEEVPEEKATGRRVAEFRAGLEAKVI